MITLFIFNQLRFKGQKQTFQKALIPTFDNNFMSTK